MHGAMIQTNVVPSTNTTSEFRNFMLPSWC